MRRGMNRIRGIIMIAFGLLWMGQGLGYIGGGFMVGDITWTYVGGVLALAGVVVLWVSHARGPAPRSDSRAETPRG